MTKRRGAKFMVFGTAAALALAACGGDGDGGDGAVEASPGLDVCVDDPNACNTGEVGEGGEVTTLISLPFEAWSQLRAGGNSVYVLQALQGIFPNEESRYEPDGSWVWDENFFAEIPQVVNEDPQTIEYTISDDAVWNDGTPVTARDVKYVWYATSGDEALCAECEPPSTADGGLIESIEGSNDDKTVTVTLKAGEKNPEWEPAYGGTSPHPAHLVDAAGFDWENDPAAMNESTTWFAETMPEWSGGPWIIESGQLTETVVKVPNESYGGPQPALDRVVGEVVADPATWIQALSNRDLDAGSPATFDVDVWNELPTIGGLYSAAGSAGAVWEHIDLNTANPFLADQALREAIFTTIDLEHASGSIWGAAEGLEVTLRLNHNFSQLSPYFEDQRSDTGFGSGDVEAARAILEAAGYTGTEEGGTLTTPGGEAVELNFRWTAGNTNRARTGELVQSYLADIGISVELVDSDDLGGMLAAGDYDMVIFGWSGSPRFVSSLTQLWSSESGSNYNGIDNADIDRLGGEAQAQTDLDASADVANELGTILMAEAVVLPMWDSPNMDFVFDDLANLRPNHNSSARVWYNQQDWGYVAE